MTYSETFVNIYELDLIELQFMPFILSHIRSFNLRVYFNRTNR